MKRLFILAFALVLASCASKPAGYRDASVPMQAVVGFQPELAARLWDEVAAIGRQPGGQWLMVLSGGAVLNVTAPGITGQMSPMGPGRLSLNGREVRVLWVDTAYRTLVLAAVDGTFATVLNDGPDLPADRAQVVREILDWNGFDLNQLR
ncbi:lipocalin [Maritimibacter sp. DP1N21-5]|uniref:lipocalin n=1 Tax=Maritimibacter sp. DP1N21-5 TaxID=2836867 RepID=UPI001C489CA2|nr:lipocalin [Maritimibacter sp. DP1N21-5]MBV7409334.1 lipocalin [Maritimibacter sp. DP1N21-5]